MNLPTMLTLFRILCIPVIVICYYLPLSWAHPLAALLFVVAAVTDWLDGYLARTLSQTTRLGAFLDPVADKLVVAVSLVILVANPALNFLVLPAAIIIGREIIISALREWMAEIGKRTSVAVHFIGKVKTLCQMIAIPLLLWYSPSSWEWIRWLGLVGICLAAILTLWSMVIYLRLAWPDFLQGRSNFS